MTPAVMLAVVGAYFAILLAVAWRTSRHATNDSFFIGNRSSHWLAVALGMVGTSLSGVTFVSVPGSVGREGFTYFQIVLGHFIGYMVIGWVLLPIYYRGHVTSIYDYLGTRLGPAAHRTGSAFFILSRTLGASARLFLVVNILQVAILDGVGVPFAASAAVILALILAYTYEGGVKTIVWTDLLQTACMLGGLAVMVASLLTRLDISFLESVLRLNEAGLATMFSTDVSSADYAGKQVLAGIFIAVAMTGMDQEMMQKNISVRTLRDSQKNILTLAFVMLGVVLLFLYLGGLLHLFAPLAGVDAAGDRLFPAVVLGHFPAAMQLVFLVALVSALFPSADGALTALTSSFCIDILGIKERAELSEERRTSIRHRVHLAFAAVFLALLLVFKWAATPSMVYLILTLAGYTYGPLLGLFAFGILTRRAVLDRWVPVVAIAAPAICFAIDRNQAALFGDYRIGLEMLVLNGALTFAGLWLISSKGKA
jgi:Na+/proline symporter